MEDYLIYVALGLVGLALGSFAGATVWRLRAQQLTEDKMAGEKVDEKEYKQLVNLTKTKKVSADRSQCLHCNNQLRWYDLIPLISWLQLRGKCRYCSKSIGYFEPLMEIGVATFFLVSHAAWPVELVDAMSVALFITWLVAGVGLAVLFAYDAKWFLLPDSVVFSLVGVGLVATVLRAVSSSDPVSVLLSTAGALIVLSGLYYVLYLVSNGAWVGFGDVKLGIVLALLLGDWMLAILALFTANLIGCLIVIPAMIAGKVTRTTRVPFGPMLIGGFFLSALWGASVLDWYFLIY